MRTSKQKTLTALLAGLVTVGVASCQDTPPPDRTGAAENAIEGQILDELQVSSEATCAEPVAADPGTTFTCVAAADDGNTYEYIATIVSDRELTIALHP